MGAADMTSIAMMTVPKRQGLRQQNCWTFLHCARHRSSTAVHSPRRTLLGLCLPLPTLPLAVPPTVSSHTALLSTPTSTTRSQAR